MSAIEQLEQRRLDRFKFLDALYERASGRTQHQVSMYEIGESLSFSREQIEAILDYLSGERLAKCETLDGLISITHGGVVEVEKALSNPEKPTQYFPPVINVLHVGRMENSQIQQGATASSIKASFGATEVGALKELLEDIRSNLSSFNFGSSDEQEAFSELDTLDAQARSPKPKTSIIRESLVSLRHVLEHAAGHAVAVEFVTRISGFLAHLS
jgi:hypothetical protein